MRAIWRAGASLFYLLTILGGLLAGWIVFGSFQNMTQNAGPDFSAVIAVTLAVIPYCIARAFDRMAEIDIIAAEAPVKYQGPACRFCAKPIAANAPRCPHCNSKLI